MEYNVKNGFRFRRSDGRGKYGKLVFYLRPDVQCLNRSHRITGNNYQECADKALRIIEKRFTPLSLFRIDQEFSIVASNEKTARMEYDRICERSKKGTSYSVEFIQVICKEQDT